MCWQIPRKVFLRLGGLAIKSVINVVPQRFFCILLHCQNYFYFIILYTFPFYCVVCTWYVVTYKSKSYFLVADRYFFSIDFCLFRRLVQFCARCSRLWACLRTGYELEKFALLKKCRLNFNFLTNPVHLVYWPKFHEFLITCEIVFFTWIFIVTILRSPEDYRLQMQRYS